MLVQTKINKMDKKLNINFIIVALLLLYFNQSMAQMDTRPEPYGGNQFMRDFICEEMCYPEVALKNKVEGTVEVKATVLQDGKTVNYFVTKSVSPELDKEALRICKLIMFYPAVKSSKNLIDDVVIPVKFSIKKYQRKCKQEASIKYQPYEGPKDTSMLVYATKTLNSRPVPVFEDPNMNFSKFIMENIKYPGSAYNLNIEGEVELSFVVETSGRVSNIEIKKPLGGGCSEEAIHLLKQIKWTPGMLKGKAVRSFMTASINFSLHSDSNHKYLPNNNNTTM